MSLMGHKITLSTGKTVMLRDPKIKHQEQAAEIAGRRTTTQMGSGIAMINESIKLLVAQVDDADIPAAKAEDLDSLFSMEEYKQVRGVVIKLMGIDEEKYVPKMEVVSYGNK